MATLDEPPVPTRESAGEPCPGGFVRFWSSPRLAVALLGAISAASALGTLIPQGDPSAIFAMEGLSEPARTFLIAITAHDVFFSAWYLGLQLLFFLNLAVCTCTRVWSRSRREIRYGPLVAHLGLFVVLGGSILSALTGFRHGFTLRPGEVFPVRDAVMASGLRGPLAAPPPDLGLRLEGSRALYYDDGTLKQFFGAVSIFEAGRFRRHGNLRVGEPLVHQGVWVYLEAPDEGRRGPSARFQAKADPGLPAIVLGCFVVGFGALLSLVGTRPIPRG